jgi:hypothetical protein
LDVAVFVFALVFALVFVLVFVLVEETARRFDGCEFCRLFDAARFVLLVGVFISLLGFFFSGGSMCIF